MNTVTFNKKEFLKATDVAKRFKYTTDYVGQLCRSGKVEARRIGRSWYVNVDSVHAYRKTKHATQKGIDTPSQVPQKTSAKRVVYPVPRTKTTRMVQSAQRNTVPQTTYSSDQETLLPIIGATAEEPMSVVRDIPSITITREPSRDLSIAGSDNVANTFLPEKIPEISLSGNISVSNSSAAAATTGANQRESDSPHSASRTSRPKSVITTQSSENNNVQHSTKHTAASSKMATVDLVSEQRKAQGQQDRRADEIASTSSIERSKESHAVRYQIALPMISVLISLTVAFFVVGLESHVEVFGGDSKSSWLFEFENAYALLQRLTA